MGEILILDQDYYCQLLIERKEGRKARKKVNRSKQSKERGHITNIYIYIYIYI